jgi:hypothetical protein
VRPTISAIVTLLDKNGDHQISPTEFKGWLQAVGVSDDDADASFAAIDANGNGYLTIDELVNAVRDFHRGTLDVPLLGSRATRRRGAACSCTGGRRGSNRGMPRMG